MGLRPGHCYSTLKDRAYTRTAVTVHEKNYIGTSPVVRIKQFNMGNPAKNYSHILDLIAEEPAQIRDNAMESARMAVNRYLHNKAGKENYFMRIRVYPYHIMRENKQAQGAGADRVSQGMSHAFGKPIGRAIRIKKGQVLISVLVDEANIETAKSGLLRANSKIPCKCKVKVHTDTESIGTRPRAVKIAEAEKKETEGVTAAETTETAKEEKAGKEEKKEEKSAKKEEEKGKK
ncbi:MAG: 50S ribosomal protein L16 [Candidatus Diapherotrites archaeon]